MYSRIILFLLVIVIGAFFYLHTINPVEVSITVTKDLIYTMPVTVLIFFGFFAGVTLAVVNSLFVDARRVIKDIRVRREKKQREQSEVNYRMGTGELLRGNPEKALQHFERALAANPEDIDILLCLARANMETKRPEEAMRVLEAGLLKDPGNMEVLSAVAKDSLVIGDSYKAAKTFKDMLEIDPSNPFALTGLRDLRIEEGEWEEAAALQKRLVSRGRNGKDLVKERGLLTGLLYESAAKFMAEGDLDAAEDKANEALKTDDAFIPAHVLLGDLYLMREKPADALKRWEKAFDKHNEVALFLRLEDTHLKASDPRKILDKYEKAIARSPGDINLRLLLSRLYLRLEMVDDAIDELERLGSEGEEGFYHRILLGEAYSRREQGSKSAALFKSALGLDKEIPPPFQCSSCNHSVLDWQPRCQDCKSWNTLRMSVEFSPAATSHTHSSGEGPTQ